MHVPRTEADILGGERHFERAIRRDAHAVGRGLGSTESPAAAAVRLPSSKMSVRVALAWRASLVVFGSSRALPELPELPLQSGVSTRK